MNRELILEQYKKVFDENGNITACGRFKCIELINSLSEMFPNINFGDTKTGFMNVDIIKKYIKEI